MFNTRPDINSLFGRYNISRFTGNIVIQDEINPFKDYILRETGIQKDYMNTARAIQALDDPGAYLTQKNEDLMRISQELQDYFLERYKKYMNRGYEQSRAQELATEELKAKKADLYIDHGRKFPSAIRDPTMAKAPIGADGGR